MTTRLDWSLGADSDRVADSGRAIEYGAGRAGNGSPVRYRLVAECGVVGVYLWIPDVCSPGDGLWRRLTTKRDMITAGEWCQRHNDETGQLAL